MEDIWFEATGGIDLWGEWNWSGGYRFNIKPGQFGNFYGYDGQVSKRILFNLDKKQPKNPSWTVTINLSSNYGSKQIKQFKERSLRKARQRIKKYVQDYESTDDFKLNVWPTLVHEYRLIEIIKMVNRKPIWIATSWERGGVSFTGYGLNGYKTVYGSGVFYTRSRDVDYDYKNDTYVFKRYFWRKHEVSYGTYCSSGISDNEGLIKELETAFYDFHSLTELYIAQSSIREAYERRLYG